LLRLLLRPRMRLFCPGLIECFDPRWLVTHAKRTGAPGTGYPAVRVHSMVLSFNRG
jgi:hypothetical protein